MGSQGEHSKMAKVFATFLSCSLLWAGMPAVIAAPPKAGGTHSDPVSYCRAYSTVDQPGSRYTGPKAPTWMFRALKLDQEVYPDDSARLVWRCMNGRVLACYVYNDPETCVKPMPRGQYTVDARGYISDSYDDITDFRQPVRTASRASGRDTYFAKVPADYVRSRPMAAGQVRYISQNCRWRKDAAHPSPHEVREDFDGDGRTDTAVLLVNRNDPNLWGLLIITTSRGTFFIPDRTRTGDSIVATEFLMLGRKGFTVTDPFNDLSVRSTATWVSGVNCQKSKSAHVFDPRLGYFRNLWIGD